MEQIGELITPEISNYFANETQSMVYQDFINFQSKINTLLSKIKVFSAQVERQSTQLDRHDDGTISGSSLMRSLKQTQAIANWDGQIENLLREGSVLIQEFRQFLTGETINYHIGIMYYGTIYEFNVPEVELLKHVKVSYATNRTDFSRLFTLKLGAKGYGKGSLIKEWQQYQLTSSVGKLSTQNVFKNFQKNITAKNLGNIYEATKKYQYQKGRKSYASVFSSITKNIISSTKGGDFDNIQYKFFGKSSPTLADMSVIVNTLEACQELFSIAPVQMGEKIKEIFVKDKSQVDSKIEKASLKEINNHIDELIKTLQI